MRLLFIIKPFQFEPLGIMYLSSALKARGHDVNLVSTEEDIFGAVKKFSPKIIGYSVVTGNEGFFLELNRRIKRSFHFLSVMGGPHATFFPEVINEDGVDVVCRGEGEEALVEMCEKLDQGKEIIEIRNLVVKEGNGKVHANALRSLIRDLDGVKFPDRELVYGYQHIRFGPIKHFLSSRGCPHNCRYCFNHAYFSLYKNEPRMRFRSVENLIGEIEQVKARHPMKMVWFTDDVFAMRRSWLEEFTQEYRKRTSLPFHCSIRPDMVSQDFAGLLREAGCNSVQLAVETGNETLRNLVLGRSIKTETILHASELLKENGIKFVLQNMVGLPDSSLKMDMETLELNIRCDPAYAWVSIYQPYPKTQLAEYAKRQGLLKGNFAVSSNIFTKSILNIANKRKVENLQNWFAVACRFPILKRLGILDILIAVPRLAILRRVYHCVFCSFRKIADNELFGFKLHRMWFS